jgi:hypothetical protein
MTTGGDVPLLKHVEDLLALERELRQQRWEDHAEVHRLLKEAVDAAVKALNVRLEAMNEFRGQITSERGNYVTRENYDLRHDELKNKIGQLENHKANIEGRLWMVGTGLTALVIVINILFRFWPSLHAATP